MEDKPVSNRDNNVDINTNSDAKVNPDTNSGKDSVNRKKIPVIPRQYLFGFAIVTFLFALWGFANDVTNPMVAAFKNILLISNFESSLVQFAFYGGYCLMAIPAAIFIKRYSYKAGILMGLTLYTLGCLMFVPAGWLMAFGAFLLAYFVMTCGLSFLETSCNPYILSMGAEETSTQRLNFAQSFNPMGSIVGMLIAGQVILISINSTTETGRRFMQNASRGQLCHVQALEKSLADIDQASNKLIRLENDKKVGVRDVSKVLDPLKSATTILATLDDSRGEQAIKLRDAIDKAKLKAPRIISKAKALITKDPEILAAEKAYKDQLAKLDKFNGGNRDALDIEILNYRESLVLNKTAPEALKEAQKLTANARKELQAIRAKLEMALKGQSLSAKDRQELNKLMLQIKTPIQTAIAKLNSIPKSAYKDWQAEMAKQLHDIRHTDLEVIVGPYTILGFTVLATLLVFIFSKLPRFRSEDNKKLDIRGTFGRLIKNRKYIEGVIAQAFYVGAQIMCWTFIIQYAGSELGMAKSTAQNYNIIAMVIFVSSRFICTFLLKYFSPGGLLMALAIGGFTLVLGVIFVKGMYGLYCLIGVSACMSLMFPTIYGIALKGLGDDAKMGAAGLILAIGGGALMPPMQGAIMDMNPFNLGFMTLSSARASFVLPLICFVVIAIFGFRTSNVHKHTR